MTDEQNKMPEVWLFEIYDDGLDPPRWCWAVKTGEMPLQDSWRPDAVRNVRRLGDVASAYRRGQEDMRARASREANSRWIGGAAAEVMWAYIRDLPIKGEP